MVIKLGKTMSRTQLRNAATAACVIFLLASAVGTGMARPNDRSASAQEAPASDAPAQEAFSPEQLESLVAPIALYPDPLLAQTLVAATYPLEIIQLQQWLMKNPDLTDQALIDAVAEQPWEPAIQSMAAVPEVVDRLANDLQWTTDLGNAFLAQQADVMDATQRMRTKAQENGALESTEQVVVETTVIEQETVIIVETADPEIIYVPSYSPVVVYGPPVYYSYPPIYYPPPPPPGAALVAFSIGVAWGAAWGGSCCGCGWGHNHNDIHINVDNNFNRDLDINRGDGGNWQHNPDHRGAAPYGDRATANKFDGAARGDSPSQRASASTRPQGGTSGRGTGAGSPTASNRSRDAAGGAGASGRSPTASPSSRAASSQIGSRNIPPSASASSRSGFSTGSQGFTRSSAQASRSRGAASMGSRGGRRGGRG